VILHHSDVEVGAKARHDSQATNEVAIHPEQPLTMDVHNALVL